MEIQPEDAAEQSESEDSVTTTGTRLPDDPENLHFLEDDAGNLYAEHRETGDLTAISTESGEETELSPAILDPDSSNVDELDPASPMTIRSADIDEDVRQGD